MALGHQSAKRKGSSHGSTFVSLCQIKNKIRYVVDICIAAEAGEVYDAWRQAMLESCVMKTILTSSVSLDTERELEQRCSTHPRAHRDNRPARAAAPVLRGRTGARSSRDCGGLRRYRDIP